MCGQLVCPPILEQLRQLAFRKIRNALRRFKVDWMRNKIDIYDCHATATSPPSRTQSFASKAVAVLREDTPFCLNKK